jgi:hypothetical protein
VPSPQALPRERFSPSAFVGRGRRTQLRNSTIYWDEGNRAIWLVPRGLNIVQMSCAVSVLNVDPSECSVSGYEIRYSSGFLMAIIIFFLVVGWTISDDVAASGNSPPPWQFFPIAALLLLIFLSMQIWRSRSRMEKLVRDGLSEFRGGRD